MRSRAYEHYQLAIGEHVYNSTGNAIWVIGPSGSGKSTFIQSLGTDPFEPFKKGVWHCETDWILRKDFSPGNILADHGRCAPPPERQERRRGSNEAIIIAPPHQAMINRPRGRGRQNLKDYRHYIAHYFQICETLRCWERETRLDRILAWAWEDGSPGLIRVRDFQDLAPYLN